MMNTYIRTSSLRSISLSLVLVLMSIASFAQIGQSLKAEKFVLHYDQENQRIPFSIDQSQELITLCGLEIGAEYSLLATAFNHPDCKFKINLFTKGNDEESPNPDVIDYSEDMIFTAEAACVQFYISESNCSNFEDLPLDLSVMPTYCTPEENAMMSSVAVLSTDYDYTIEELITEIFIGGGCFDVSNVQLIGNTNGAGHFSNGTTNVGFEEGVILASGNIGNAEGPNDAGGAGTNFNDTSGDPDLNLLGAGSVRDAVGIEFDFTPTLDVINFDYVFASEEYCEYVNSTFNDVFGFFISGPGINGPFTNNAENIALVPGTANYVAINSVNHLVNTAYFVPNSGGCGGTTNPTEIQYDGYTTVLTATTEVIPCETYHIRMVVSDIGDGILDSGVFLKANSFEAGGQAGVSVIIPSIGSDGIAYEGCSNGELIFERDPDSPLDQDYVVEFTIDPSSTATNGVDYSTIPSPVTIPAGQSTLIIPFDAFEDGIVEGLETVIIQLDNPCSCNSSSVEILIDDLIPLEVTLEDVVACGSAEVVLAPTVLGGVPDLVYQWSTGETSTSISVSTTTDNSYSVTVSDVCGMSAEASALVEVIPFSTASLSGEGAVCDENTTTELEITFTGEGPWELYYTQDGAPVGPITGITDNPYILVVDGPGIIELSSLTDASGLCPGAVDGIVTIETLVIDIFPDIIDVTCSGNDDGSIFVVADGGTPDYIYTWSNGVDGVLNNELAPGSYTVTATDVNGCTTEQTYNVNEAPEIIAELAVDGMINCQSSEGGSIDLTVNGGLPIYDYLWSTGEVTEDLFNLSEGAYSVTVFDSNGCTTEAAIDLVGNFDEPIAVANVDGLIDCSGGVANISGAGSTGSGGSVSYEWYLDGVLVSTLENFETADIGNYVLIVTDNTNGCTAEAAVDVDTNIDEPVAVANPLSQITCINTVGTLDGTGSSGIGTLNYQWYDASGNLVGTGQTINVNAGGDYILIVTDSSNGCSSEAPVSISENQDPPIPFIIPPGQLDCNTTSVLIDGSGSTGDGSETYQWYFNGTPIDQAPTIDVTNPGNYSLIITNGFNGCTAEEFVNVTQDLNPPPATIEIPDQLTCAELSVILTTSVAGPYEWLDASGTVLGTDPDLEVMTPGTYILSVTSQMNGCTAETSVQVTENIVDPIAMTGADGVLNCGGATANITGAGSSTGPGITYEWFNEAGVIVGTSLDIDVTEIGTYTLVVTNGANGCTSEATSIVTPDTDLPNIEVVPPLDLTCLNDIATLVGSSSSTGNIEFGWYEGSTLVSNDAVTDVTDPGIYTFIVTNTDNGCVSEATVEVTQNQDDPIPITEVNGIISCTDGFVFLIGDASEPFGLIEYEWLDPSGTFISNEELVEVSEAGQYTLIITNTENGCTAELPAIVESDEDLPTPVAIPDGILTCDEGMVTIDGSGSSGSGTITYEWMSGTTVISTDPSVDVDAAGTYTLVITNQFNGCTATVDAIVDESQELPIAQIDPVGLIDCVNEMVTINAGGSSGNGNLNLEWFESGSPIGTGTSIDVENAGTYTVIVTDDSNGCTAEASITIEEDDEVPIPAAANDGILTCVNDAVNLTGSASGNGTLVYEWSGPTGPIGTDNPVQVNAPGTYTLVVTNSDNGCSETTTVEVDENLTTPTAVTGPDGNLTCTVDEVTLDGTGSSTGTTIIYEWQNPGGVIVSTDLTADVSEVGTYTLIVTNTENGCTESATVSVTPDVNLPIVEAGLPQVLNCDIDMVTITGNVSGNGPFEYEWLDANDLSLGGELEQEVTEEGVYTLVVTNSGNGCSSSASVQVSLDELAPPADAGTPQLLTCDVEMVTLNGNGSDGVAYEWTDPNGTVIGANQTVEVELPGTYQILVTGANACTSLATVDVAVDDELPIADPGVEGLLTCEQDMVTLGGTQTTTGTGITYEWLDENNVVVGTEITLDVITPGTYTLNVYNTTNNCDATGQVEVALDQSYPEVDPGLGGELNCLVTEIMIGGTGTDTGSNIEIIWLDQNGTPVGSDPEIMVEDPGTYTLLVTNTTSSCSASQTVEVTEDNVDPTADAGAPQLLTCDANTVTLNGSASDGATFEWTDPNGTVISENETVEVELPGTYQILVTGSNGCTSFATVDVDVDADLPVADPGATGLLTCTEDMVTLGGVQTTTGPGITYEWLDENNVVVGNDITLDVISPGTYTLNVYNTNNDCDATGQVEVELNQSYPEVDPGIGGELNCSITEIMIGGTGTDTGSDIEIIWLDQDGTQVGSDAEIMVEDPGTYTLLVTNTTSSCSASETVVVTQNDLDPSADAGANQLLDCGSNSVTLDGTNSNAPTGSIEYEWTSPSGVVISTDPSIDVAEAGTYQLLVTSENGCTSMAEVEVDLDAEVPQPFAVNDGVLTCENEAVNLSGTVAGGGTIVYEWQDESGALLGSDNPITISSPGVYTLNVLNQDNGCSGTTTVVVEENLTTPTALAGPDDMITCDETVANLDGTGSSVGPEITYAWLSPGGVTVSTEITADVTEIGIYTIIVTNETSGCTETATVEVTPDANLPIADAGLPQMLDCNIEMVTLSGTGSSTGTNIDYQWFDPAGAPVSTDLTIDVASAGTYVLEITNTTNGCTATASVQVDEDLTPPIADAGAPQLIDCDVSVVTLNGSASDGVAFEWINETGTVISTTTTVDVEEEGTYQLLVTGANGCTSMAEVDVNLDTNVPVADAGIGGLLTCVEEMVTLGGTTTSTGPGIIYEWLDENNVVVGENPTLDVTLPGTYTLNVYNALNNCESTAEAIVTEDQDYPVVDPGVTGTLTCDLIEIMLGGTGSTTGPEITYSWLDASGTEVGTELELAVETAGIYTLVVSNTTNDCVSTASIEVDDNLNPPTANAGQNQLLTCDIIAVNLDGSGSIPNSGTLEYEWTNAGGVVVGTTSGVSVEEAGTYQLLVTGDNGCTAVANVDVEVDAEVPVADAGPGGQLDCNVDMVTVGGPTTSTGAGIIYEWTNSAGQVVGTTPMLDVTDAGTYVLTVFNQNNNCDISSSVEVMEDLATPVADPGIGALLTCELLEINLGGGATTTGPGIEYSWENEMGVVVGTEVELDITNPGTYTLYVNNTNNGCSSNQAITINQDVLDPVADAGAPSDLTCEITSVVLDGSGSSLGSEFTYEWYNSNNVLVSTDMSPSITAADDYTLIVTNTNNACTATSAVSITPDENLPTALAATPNMLTCAIQEVALDGTASTTTSGQINYEWQDATLTTIATTSNTMVSQPGIYTLVITDPNNGCTTTTSVDVPQNIEDPTAFAGSPATITCDQAEVTLNGSGTGNALQYEWFNDSNVSVGTSATVTVEIVGTYTLVVTNGMNGCTATSSVEVAPDNNVPVAEAGDNGMLTCVVDQIVLNATGSSTGTDITYEWLSPSGISLGSDPSITVTETGAYTLIVYDSNNDCSSQDQVFVMEDMNTPIPDITAIGATAITCETSEVVLDGSFSAPFNDLTFLWSTANGNITTDPTAPQMEANEPGTYNLVVTNTVNGCTEEMSFDVGIDMEDPVAVVAEPPVLTCDLESFNLNANASSTNGDFEYVWTSSPAGGIISGGATLTPMIGQAGVFTLTVTNAINGCVSTTSITVGEDTETPDAAASVDDILDCLTESLNLSGNGSSNGSGFTYLWTGAGLLNGETTLSPEVNAAGNYVLLVTDQNNGCTETATIEVEENPEMPVDLDLDPTSPLCYGNLGTLGVVSVTGGEGPYSYSLDGEFFFTDTVFAVPAGTTTVYVQDIVGCTYEEEVYVADVQPVGVQLDANLSISLGEETQLLATTNIPDWLIDTIIWTPADSLSCTNCLDPYANPTSTTTYTVTVINDKGCDDTAEVRVEVSKDRDIYIPNAFSPNGDGFNDVFVVYSNGRSVKQINELHVYNRWGEELFENTNFQPDDETHGWNGMFREELMNPAVFVYWCEIEFEDGFVKLYKGDITIVK